MADYRLLSRSKASLNFPSVSVQAVIRWADERIKQRTDLKVADLESSLVDLKAQEQTAIATLRLRTKSRTGQIGSFRGLFQVGYRRLNDRKERILILSNAKNPEW